MTETTDLIILKVGTVHDLSEDDPAPDSSPRYFPTCRQPLHSGMLGTLEPCKVTCPECKLLRPPKCWR